MKQDDLRNIADDLSTAAKFYIEDAVNDRVDGRVRAAFNAAVDARKLGDCIEMSQNPSSFFFDVVKKKDGTGIRTFNNGKTQLVRIVADKLEFNIEDMAADGGKFIQALDICVKDYVDKIPVNVTHLAVPALFISVRAYTVECILWGYCGVPVADEDKKE